MISLISVTIYLYIFVCLAFLFFNISYIVFSKGTIFFQKRRRQRFMVTLELECSRIEEGGVASQEHHQFLLKKLKSITNLIAYDAAVDALRPEGVPLQSYFDAYAESFQSLAYFYRNKPAMYRAYYASLMAEYKPLRRNNEELCNLLLTYFDNSSTFCRENILKALYSLGHPSSIVHAFTLMNENNYPHARLLLADGLMNYSGDRIALAWLLWEKAKQFNDSFQVAIVQFAGKLSDEFSINFLLALSNKNTPRETRFALIRYFARRHYPPAKKILLQFFEGEQIHENSYAIAAAYALSNYPSEESRAALIRAIQSRNYYVRKNAAASLVKLGVTEEDWQKVYSSGDRYAIEMLEYMNSR